LAGYECIAGDLCLRNRPEDFKQPYCGWPGTPACVSRDGASSCWHRGVRWRNWCIHCGDLYQSCCTYTNYPCDYGKCTIKYPHVGGVCEPKKPDEDKIVGDKLILQIANRSLKTDKVYRAQLSFDPNTRILKPINPPDWSVGGPIYVTLQGTPNGTMTLSFEKVQADEYRANCTWTLRANRINGKCIGTTADAVTSGSYR